MNADFWAGRSVLVTGHTGFKGAWLALWLTRAGASVAGYSLPPGEPSFFSQAGVSDGIASDTGDILDVDELARCIDRHRPEVVFHLAAQSLVRRGYSEPALTYETNVVGTANVLDAVRRSDSTTAVVNVTSDKVYLNDGSGRAFREDDALGGHDPYSDSKACSELLTRAYVRSYFASPDTARVATARAGNVLGGGDWGADRLVPDLMRAATSDGVATIRNPNSTRPWQHVLDCLNGYLTLAEALCDRDDVAGPWNFGPADAPQPVRWVVERIQRLWDGAPRTEFVSDSTLPEAPTLAVDASKAMQLLEWRPRLGLERTLEWVVEWHRHVDDGGSAREMALAQIEAFALQEVGTGR